MSSNAIVHYVAPKCPMCGKGRSFDLPLAGIEAWRAGALIQDAFPELSPDDREQVMTGIDADCWSKL